MGFVGANMINRRFEPGRDDIQDDTYLMISKLIAGAAGAYMDKDLAALHSNLEVIYMTLHQRFSKEQRRVIEQDIEHINKAIYGRSGARSLSEASNTFNEAKLLYKRIMGVLDNKGILLRARVDPNTLITQGGV